MPVLPSSLLEHLGDRLLAQTSDGRFPLTGQWEITCRCNLKCRMCYTDPFNTPERIRQELGTAEILRILDELQNAGCLELTLTGGEPLARPDFPEIYRAAHERGFLLTVFTNATLLSDRIVDLWTARRPHRVEVSLHGITEDVFERVTGIPGSFNPCLEAIHRLRALQIPLTLKATALSLNKEEIPAIKKFVDSLGVPFMLGEYLRDDVALSGAPYQFQLEEDQLAAIERQDPALEAAKQQDLHEWQQQRGGCASGKTRFHIDAYGRLQLCSGNRRGSYDLRKGTFREGFFEVLPTLPCPNRQEALQPAPSFIPLPVRQEA